VAKKMKVQGWDELDKKFNQLTNIKDMQKVMRSGVVFALTPVVKQAKNTAPQGDKAHKTSKGRLVSSGFAARSVKKRTIKGKKGDGFVIKGIVGLSAEAWYATLYSTGFSRQGNSFSGDNWLAKSLEQNQGVVFNRFKQKMHKAIAKIAKS
jgi:hypothetical protein